MGRLDVDAGVVDLPAVTGALTGCARRARRAGRRRTSRRSPSSATARAAARRHRRRGARHPVARRHRRPRHQRRPRAAARLPPAGPDHQGPAERGEVLRPARRRARSLHGGRHAGDRLPGHRDLLPPDRRRARRRREDRLLQPARHAPEQHGDRQHPELRRAVHARGCATRTVSDVEDVDQCDYDLVADDDFVLGPGPGRPQRLRRRRVARHRLQVRPMGGARAGRARGRRAAPSTTSPASTRPASCTKGGHRWRVRRSRTLQQRLSDGVVLGAEGYVFELERRGYVKAGPFVPEVILDEPDALRQLHREFLRAGSDVMVALTYYAHRDKLRGVGRADDLEEMNRQAVQDRQRDRRRGRRPRGRQHLQHLGLRPLGPGGVGRGRPRAVRGAARLGGAGGRRLRHRRDQRLPRRGADRPARSARSSACRRWSPSPACRSRRPTTATTTSRRAGSWPTAARRSSG